MQKKIKGIDMNNTLINNPHSPYKPLSQYDALRLNVKSLNNQLLKIERQIEAIEHGYAMIKTEEDEILVESDLLHEDHTPFGIASKVVDFNYDVVLSELHNRQKVIDNRLAMTGLRKQQLNNQVEVLFKEIDLIEDVKLKKHSRRQSYYYIVLTIMAILSIGIIASNLIPESNLVATGVFVIGLNVLLAIKLYNGFDRHTSKPSLISHTRGLPL